MENRLPAGQETWNESAIVLPQNLAGHKFKNILTREEVKPVPAGDAAHLPLAETPRVLPVVILRGEG